RACHSRDSRPTRLTTGAPSARRFARASAYCVGTSHRAAIGPDDRTRGRPRTAQATTRLSNLASASVLVAVHGTQPEPLARGAEQDHVVLFPHGVVRRAGQVDEHLLLGAQR